MSVNRGQESHSRHEKKQRESSTTKKHTGEESADGRPIITQDKSAKTEKEKYSKRNEVLADEVKKAKRKTDRDGVRKHEPEETRRRNENKLDPIYLKRLLEKKLVKKEGEKGKERPMKRPLESETKKEKSKNRKDGTRTRTLSPTEVKQLIPPRVEIASAEAEKRVEEVQENFKDYEDDFEDYESDFEEESMREEPQEETIKKDSEVEELWKKEAKRREMEAIKESIEKENYAVTRRKKPDVASNENESSEDKKTITVTDLVGSQRTKKQRSRRGEELLNMITLDAISYNILEIPPIPYEEFMKAFGTTNTKQAYVQTNEDDLDEEIQTDKIMAANKWTQNPPEYLGNKQNISYVLTKEERLGVGGDVPTEEETTKQWGANALSKFLSWASQIVLIVLERKSGNFLSLENMPNHSKAMAFGDGFVNLNVSDIPFLKGKSVPHLCVLPKNLGKLLSVHVNNEKSFQKTMVCLWSLRELSKPLRVLMASNRVTSCCFGPNQGNLVFAGLSDGYTFRSVCVWDLREPSGIHNRMIGEQEWSLQSPTYTTAGNMGQDVRDCSPIVAMRILNNVDGFSGFGDFTPAQICSLNKYGDITIWTVVQLENVQKNAPLEDLGLAHWGRVKLIKSSGFSIFASLRDEIPGLYITCKDLLIHEGEGDDLYVANSLGSVHHCSSYGYTLNPKFYIPAKEDAIIEATCLELCPFNDNYFLVGCGDGSIRLHSRNQETPLISLNSTTAADDKEAAVMSLSWMKMRPCVFFALDSMSRINIWDLRMSDMYPEVTLRLTEKRIVSMKLVAVSEPRQIPFMIIGTESGSIEIHRLKKEFGSRSDKEVQNEMKMFLKYVSIL